MGFCVCFSRMESNEAPYMRCLIIIILSKIGKEEIVFKSEQHQAVRHMYDGRDSYAVTTWRARFTVYIIYSAPTRPEPIIPQFFPIILFLNSYKFNHYSRRTTTLFPSKTDYSCI